MISPTYYPHIGGVEYVVKSVAERLVKMGGHEITVLAGGEPEIEGPREEEINSVRVIRWPTWSQVVLTTCLKGEMHCKNFSRR